MTKQEQICQALIELGHKEVKHKTTKFRVFTRPGDCFYFVGKNGGLRTGKKLGETIGLGPKNINSILTRAQAVIK